MPKKRSYCNYCFDLVFINKRLMIRTDGCEYCYVDLCYKCIYKKDINYEFPFYPGQFRLATKEQENKYIKLKKIL